MRVLVTGARGQLGTELVRELGDHDVTGVDRNTLDVTRRHDVLACLTGLRPDVVVHAAAWTQVDACELDPDRAWATNALATRHVAEGARLVGARVCYVSTDYVFDGTLDRPYTEWDQTHPLSVYGASKLGGELELGPEDTAVRTSWLCGRHGANFVTAILDRARTVLAAEGPRVLQVVDDQWGCPTFAADLAAMIARLVTERRPGTFHVTNQGETTRYGFARAILAAAGLDPGVVTPVTTAELVPPPPAPRPASATLDNAALRLSGMELLDDHHGPLERLVKELAGR